jgi:hypothetical protein
MPTVQCACPSCLTRLQIAQAPPVKVCCPNCRQVFLMSAGPQPAAPAPAAPAPAVVPAPHITFAPGAGQATALRRANSGTALPRPAGPSGGGSKRFVFLLLAGAAALLAGLLLLALRPGKGAADDEEDLRGLPVSKQQRNVNKAVRRGVAYLKKRLADNSRLYSIGEGRGGGAHPGAVALAGLTLLECGVPADDPALRRALASVRREAPRLTFTYSVAAAILFLDRFNNPEERKVDADDRALIRSMALRLIAGQNGDGGWGYYCEALPPAYEKALLKQLRDNAFKPGTFHVPGQQTGRDDNSIGQFATLALWAARKHDVPVRAPLAATEARYRRKQNADGSWQYNDRIGFARDTSTCAGLIGLAVARGTDDEGPRPRSERPAGDLLLDPAVEKGLRHLGGVIGRQPSLSDWERSRRHRHTEELESVLRQMENTSDLREKMQLRMRLAMLDQAPLLRGIYIDGDNWGDLYFLWSLERMAVIYDLKRIQGKDWYAWGADIILASQEDDGSWTERFPGVPDTCFALLFLRKANLVKDLTDKLRRARNASPAAAAPPRRKE